MKITKTTHILFIALITVIVFSNSLKNDFAWDDQFLIKDNPHIKNWRYLPRMFMGQLYEGDGLGSNFYRPLQLVSLAVDYRVWGLNPFGYHLTSLLLHIFNSALVYLIVYAVAMSPGIAFFTALFFSVAPAISGITFYTPARSDLLMALFVFLSLLSFLKYRRDNRKPYYLASILFFILSLLSKEAAIMLPLLLLLIRPRFKYLAPYLAISAIYIGLRLTLLNFSKGINPIIDYSFPASVPLWSRVLTDFKIILMYLRILVFPAGLHMEWYIEPAKKLLQWDVLLSIAGLIFMVFTIWKASRKHNLILFGAAWFFLAMLPVLNIYPISVFFGEGWLYIPSVGFFLTAAVIFTDIIRPKIGRAWSIIFIGLFLIYYAGFTISYGKVWKNSITVFNNILRYEPGNPFTPLTYNNLAIAYYGMGEFEKSIENCEKSIQFNPEYSKPYNNMGTAYAALGRNIRAIKCFKKAIGLERDYVFSYTNLSHAYSNIGLKDKAVQISRAAINIDPMSYEAHCNLGYIYSEKGNTGEAIGYFKKASRIRPGAYEPHYCLGNIYMNNKDYKEALDEYTSAFKLGLSDYDFYNKIAFAYIRNNRFQEAEAALMRSLALNKGQSGPHTNLGNLYSMLGHFDLAVDEYRKALEIEPDGMGIFDNIVKTKKEWKRALNDRNKNDLMTNTKIQSTK